MNTLTNEEILSIAEEVGFEMNDFGKYNCTTDSILELVTIIESYYNVQGNDYDE